MFERERVKVKDMRNARVASGSGRATSPADRLPARATQRGRRLRPGDIRLLVVVDASEESARALQYVGKILVGRNRVDIHLTYISPHLEAALLESGGAEGAEREEQVESTVRAEQSRRMAMSDKKAWQILDAAQAMLQEEGVAATHIHSSVSSPLDARAAADEVILLARDQQCKTVVVGHRAHTWFSGFGHGHLAEHLVRSADGFAIWVID